MYLDASGITVKPTRHDATALKDLLLDPTCTAKKIDALLQGLAHHQLTASAPVGCLVGRGPWSDCELPCPARQVSQVTFAGGSVLL